MCGSAPLCGAEWEWWAERLYAVDTAYWERYMRDGHPQPWHYQVAAQPPLPSVHNELTVPRTVHMEHTDLPSTPDLVDPTGALQRVLHCLSMAQRMWEREGGHRSQ
jgi:hypothetical protein